MSDVEGSSRPAWLEEKLDTLGQAIGESFYLSSQGMSEWPTLDECVHAGKRAMREIEPTVLGAVRWGEHICSVPPGDGRVVVAHKDRYNALVEAADIVAALAAAEKEFKAEEIVDESFVIWWAAARRASLRAASWQATYSSAGSTSDNVIEPS